MAATYTPIATVTANGSTSTISFTSISGSYTDLVLVAVAQSSAATTGSSLYAQFNSDTGTNYSNTWINGNGSSADSARNSNQNYASIGVITGASSGSTNFQTLVCNIQNYSNTTTYKTYLTKGGNASTGGAVRATVNLWRSTAAINRIDLVCDGVTNFTAGSTFTLYGIQAA